MDASRTWRRAVAAGLLAPLSVLAAPPPEAAPGAPAVAAGEAAAAGEDGFGPAVADDALQALRGGEGRITVAVVDNQGTVDGNTASQVVAGDNRIEGGAFAQAAGLTTVIQNSGSNVLIQNGTAINLRFGGEP